MNFLLQTHPPVTFFILVIPEDKHTRLWSVLLQTCTEQTSDLASLGSHQGEPYFCFFSPFFLHTGEKTTPSSPILLFHFGHPRIHEDKHTRLWSVLLQTCTEQTSDLTALGSHQGEPYFCFFSLLFTHRREDNTLLPHTHPHFPFPLTPQRLER